MSFLIGALIVAAIIAVVIHRGWQMKDLANNGVVGDGKVLEKFRRAHRGGSSSATYLRYEFYAADGLRYERKICVGEEIYESYEEGDPIDVVYVKKNPKVSAARYMVNLSREALKLPPL